MIETGIEDENGSMIYKGGFLHLRVVGKFWALQVLENDDGEFYVMMPYHPFTARLEQVAKHCTYFTKFPETDEQPKQRILKRDGEI